MRIVVWNCGGAFHRKWEHITRLEPDIAVITECCTPDRLPELRFGSAAWMGRLEYKGLAVLGFEDYVVAPKEVTAQLEWVLPIDVSGPVDLTLFGVWAMNHRANTHPAGFDGISQPLALADAYDLESIEGPVVITGDFNSNLIWDTPRRPRFRQLSNRYQSAGLVSMYHQQTGERFGEESIPTHWWRNRTIDGPTYHIDYAWVSNELASNAQLQIGTFDEWVTVAGSDHAALILDIDIES